VDRAIESGSTVSPAYDSLVAKVMTHAESRTAAVAALARALRDLELDGLETNRDLLGAICDDPDFIAGRAGIDYLDNRPDLRAARLPDAVRVRHAAAAGYALLEARAASSLVPIGAAGWRNVGQALHVDHLRDGAGPIDVRVPTLSDLASVRIDETSSVLGPATTDGGLVDLVAEGLRRRYRVRIAAHSVSVNGPEGQSTFALRSEDERDDGGTAGGECRAPLPGAVTKVLVSPGDLVEEGSGLVVLEAMKMEHTLRAAGPGTVTEVRCVPGQQVDVGDLLVAVEAT
jgi:propionyl-CoA carboxylase alpha chain